MEGVDFSTGRPGGAALAAAGMRFVVRYLYPGGKGISAAEIQDYHAHAISVVFNYEGSGRDATSFANGAADARYAQGFASSLGYPEAVIYFSIDEQYAPEPVQYMQGVASVIGISRTGVYGGIGTLNAIHAAGAATYYWQTYAWSGTQLAEFVHLYQYRNGQSINGAQVDFDRALRPFFGQIEATLADVNAQAFVVPSNEGEDMYAIMVAGDDARGPVEFVPGYEPSPLSAEEFGNYTGGTATVVNARQYDLAMSRWGRLKPYTSVADILDGVQNLQNQVLGTGGNFATTNHTQRLIDIKAELDQIQSQVGTGSATFPVAAVQSAAQAGAQAALGTLILKAQTN